MGAALTQAQSWLAKRAEDLPAPDRQVIGLSTERENKAQARARRVRVVLYVLVASAILGLVGWIEQSFVKEQWLWWTSQRPFVSANIWPHVLKPEAEHALQPGNSFRECAPRQQNADYCPDMVVLSNGNFLMGSLAPATDNNAYAIEFPKNEFPQHQVTIAAPFAVSKFQLTFAEWDACVAGGGCSGYKPNDLQWGRGEQPVINVNWDDAQQYVAWLSQMTGKPYRLLTEAEYEYAARAGTTTEFPWGDDIGTNHTNCAGCGSQWDNKQTAPVGSFTGGGFVGSFSPNAFGLYDMVGNVWEWVEDCFHPSYQGAPADGSAWTSADCSNRLVRGGSWNRTPGYIRSAVRFWITSGGRLSFVGIRVARTLQR